MRRTLPYEELRSQVLIFIDEMINCVTFNKNENIKIL